jgi:hypothetical protein
VLDHLSDRVEDGNAMDLAPLSPGRDTADDLRAVVEALAREVHRLPSGDALDDEREVLVEENAHWITSAGPSSPAA